ncbi:MAG TPA: acireductone synthase [Gemmatimonadaceae bacterium]|nr:acireductone synthase [Gemmatimonadaceae bacterium]
MTYAARKRPTTGVVLDVEGTTTPVSFVYDVLFPYAFERLRPFIVARLGDPEVERAIGLLREEHAAEVATGEKIPEWSVGAPGQIDALVTYLEWLMDCDRKSPGLKLLQGQIWELGYLDGTLRGEVYADVLPAFERWRASGRAIAIYSSGSVLAQRLLFANSTWGDLTGFIDNYFDTAVGPKRSRESYREIAAAMHCEPRNLLFISDVAAELEAARDAGFQTLLCVRPPAKMPDQTSSRVVQTFDDVDVLRAGISSN